MSIHPEAVDLIERFALLPATVATLPERQSIIVSLGEQHGIWSGCGGEDSQNWYTSQGERIGPLRPNMQDIEVLAGTLGVTFTPSDNTFDLDKEGDPGFVGTYVKTAAGIVSAYHALLLHQLILQKMAEVADARENKGEAHTAP